MDRIYHISTAAKKVGLHPQTLRDYERKGWITFKRDDCGSRILDAADLKKIRKIALDNLNRERQR